MANRTLGVSAVENQLGTLAALLAEVLMPADMIAFAGTLGVGKTALARALIQHYCAAETVVPSPTFSLVQIYEVSRTDTAIQRIVHADFYRLHSPDESDALNVFDDSEALVLLEWPERGALPAGREQNLWRIAIAERDSCEDIRDYHLTLPVREFADCWIHRFKTFGELSTIGE